MYILFLFTLTSCCIVRKFGVCSFGGIIGGKIGGGIIGLKLIIHLLSTTIFGRTQQDIP
jgi:hypothetical protein